MRRILIYRPGTIGDTIVAVPAIQALRRAYPAASFAFMGVGAQHGGFWAHQVLGEFGWFDDLISYDRSELQGAGTITALVGRVRRLGADMVVHLSSEQNSRLRILRDRAFFRLAGIPRFVSHASACVTWYGRLRTDDRVYPSEVDRLLAVAVAAGAVDSPPTFDLPIDAGARARVDALFQAPGFEAGRILIGLCPGAKLPAKRWPLERYGEVCRRLIDVYGASIVVVGGEQERLLADGIGAGWPRSRWLNAASSQLSILDMAEILRRCALYLGNDTGPMHVAAAVGTRCLAVFSARLPGNSWHPYGDDHVVIRRRPACRNCFLSDCTRYDTQCLTGIGTDDVWNACERMLVYR